MEGNRESETALSQRLQLHHIQKTIILSLAHQSPLRFKDLQPPRVPNNTFSYHLKKLLDYGYIELDEGGYSLTRKSLKYLVVHSNDHKPAHSPAFLTAIYVENEEGEVLLINRNHRPFQGWYGVPSGVVHFGENLQVAAKRELFEKTTIKVVDDLRYHGVLDFRYLQKETSDIFTHAVAFIYSYKFKDDRKSVLDVCTDYGQVSWSKFGRNHILPEVMTIQKMVKHKGIQQLSVEYEEPPHFEISKF